MKTTEAKKIVGYILNWQFVLMGIKERSEIKEIQDISKYSLNDLLLANKLVQANNKRKKTCISITSKKVIKQKVIQPACFLTTE